MQKVFFASLTKIADSDDDTLEVHGIANTESRDSTGELILADAIRKALPGYLQYPTIREMHGLTAAGRAIEVDVDDNGVTHVVAKIVDPGAIKKVRSKTYAGFSVGGRVLKRDPDDRTIITEIELSEISLVDRPAHPEARISLWKAAGLHDGADVFSHDLAKVATERDSLAKQLAHRDRAMADLAARTELTVKTVTAIVAENSDYRKQIADLTKRLRALPNSRTIDAVTIGKAATAIEETVAGLTARLDHIERGGRLDA